MSPYAIALIFTMFKRLSSFYTFHFFFHFSVENYDGPLVAKVGLVFLETF